MNCNGDDNQHWLVVLSTSTLSTVGRTHSNVAIIYIGLL